MKTGRSLTTDPLFLLALLAGPLAWLVLYGIFTPALRRDVPLLDPWWFIRLTVLYPVIEEIVFRGLVQELVRDHLSRSALGPLTVANLLTSVLFAALHLYTQAPLWAALVFFPSLLFGFFKERTGRLTAPIILHGFYNAGFVWLFVAPA